MHGHELRRTGRIAEAIAEFEAADRLQRDYLAREKIAPEFDWHHAHNLELLAASYQYVGQMRRAEALLKQAFALPSNLLVQVVNKREYPAFLVGKGPPRRSPGGGEDAQHASASGGSSRGPHRSRLRVAGDEPVLRKAGTHRTPRSAR